MEAEPEMPKKGKGKGKEEGKGDQWETPCRSWKNMAYGKP